MADVTSLTALTRELKRVGISTDTANLKGAARREELARRYALYSSKSVKGFVPPPPASDSREDEDFTAAPKGNRYSRELSKFPPGLVEKGLIQVPPAPRARLELARSQKPVLSRQPKSFEDVRQRTVSKLNEHSKKRAMPDRVVQNSIPETKESFEEEGKQQVGKLADVKVSFDCDKCGKSFKKVAHLIVHSKTHVTSSKKLDLKNREQGRLINHNSESERTEEKEGGHDDDHDDQATDTLWIEEFTQGLYEIAKKEELSSSQSGDQGARIDAGKPGRLERCQTGIVRRSAPPPPTTGPPGRLLRSRSTPSLTIGSGAARNAHHKSEPPLMQRAREAVIAQQALRGKIQQAEDIVLSLQSEILKMEHAKEAALQSRLVDNKELDMQELEWELNQVRTELERAQNQPGLFLDSRLGSSNGRVQRWAKEDLARRLVAMEFDLAAKLRVAEGQIRAEENNHAEYGAQAQRLRQVELNKMIDHLESLKKERAGSAALSVGSLREASRPCAEQEAGAIGQQALALHSERRDPEQAENLYRRAIALAETQGTHLDAGLLGNFALFLSERWTEQRNGLAGGQGTDDARPMSPTSPNTRRRDEEADKYFRLAIRAEPTRANNLVNYATFLKSSFKEYDRADQYFERACRAAPGSASILGKYANFLFRVRGDRAGADRMFRRALEISRVDVNILANFASMLKKTGKFQEAEGLYRRALQQQPRNASILSNYANLVAKSTNPKDTDPYAIQRLHKAQELYLQALSADPKHRSAKRNYVLFLRDFPNMRNPGNEKHVSGKKKNNTGGSRSPGSSRPRSPLLPQPKERRRNRPRSRSPGRLCSPPLDKVIE